MVSSSHTEVRTMYSQYLTRYLLGISFIFIRLAGECESCNSEAGFLSMHLGMCLLVQGNSGSTNKNVISDGVQLLHSVLISALLSAPLCFGCSPHCHYLLKTPTASHEYHML